MVADSAASNFGVSWSRNSTVVFSVCDDAQLTYMAGVGASGNKDDVWAFHFACSSAISPLEHYVFKSNEILI